MAKIFAFSFYLSDDSNFLESSVAYVILAGNDEKSWTD